VLIQEVEVEQVGGQRIAAPDRHSDTDTALIVAHRGTLFLDEVGEMSLRMQAAAVPRQR
jgi:transcriptional regulator of aromatic amino acid metabolism